MTRHMVTLGEKVRLSLIEHHVYFRVNGAPTFSQFTVDDNDQVEPYSGFYGGPALCTMGSFSYSLSRVIPGMKIGRYTSIGKSMSVSGTRHAYEWVTSSNVTYERGGQLLGAYAKANPGLVPARSIRHLQKTLPTIGNDVWIGANVQLNRGITVGDGAVIAAGSIVTRSVPDFMIVGGTPARVIKPRFEESQIEALQQLQWWQYEPTSFLHLDVTKVDEFISALELLQDELAPYRPRPVVASELVALAVSLD